MDSYKIKNHVKLIELFSGIGAQAMALRDLGVDFEHWKTSDWDVNATASYKAIHFPDDATDYSEGLDKEELIHSLHELGISSDGKNPMSVEQIKRKGINWLKNVYNNFKASHNLGSIINIHAKDLELDPSDESVILLIYSFPCQDISSAGLQRGFDEDSHTRSSLLWEVKRLLTECKEQNILPDVLLMENVNAIHNKKNIKNFQTWLKYLDSIGYHSFWQDFNAKNYGIPQNRVRTFVISLLENQQYCFPDPIFLSKKLKNVLENHVDEKYYVDTEKTRSLIKSLIESGQLPREREYCQISPQMIRESEKSPIVLKPKTEVFTETSKLETVLLRKQGTEFNKYTDVANTIMCRDYKGAGNQDFNFVIEKNE